MSIEQEEQVRKDSMTAAIEGVKSQFGVAQEQLEAGEMFKVRISPWAENGDGTFGQVNILEDSHPRSESDAVLLREALITLAADILPLYERGPEIDQAAGMEVTVTLKPSAWK